MVKTKDGKRVVCLQCGKAMKQTPEGAGFNLDDEVLDNLADRVADRIVEKSKAGSPPVEQPSESPAKPEKGGEKWK